MSNGEAATHINIVQQIMTGLRAVAKKDNRFPAFVRTAYDRDERNQVSFFAAQLARLYSSDLTSPHIGDTASA
jgi:hypothetical protein